MKQIKKTPVIVTLVLSMGFIFLYPAFAEQSASFSASCYMPRYVTMESGEMVLADSERTNQNINIAESHKIEEIKILENETELIQQEEIILENDAEIEVITTVCAR